MTDTFNFTDAFSPASSAIKDVYFNGNNNNMLVRFLESDSVVWYDDVPVERFEDFRSADSAGSYYNSHIKSYYESEVTDKVTLNHVAEPVVTDDDFDEFMDEPAFISHSEPVTDLDNSDERRAPENNYDAAPEEILVGAEGKPAPFVNSNYSITYYVLNHHDAPAVSDYHYLHFVTDGARNEDEALREFNNLVGALNLPVKIIGVTHYF